jgi:hypothetical protein
MFFFSFFFFSVAFALSLMHMYHGPYSRVRGSSFSFEFFLGVGV